MDKFGVPMPKEPTVTTLDEDLKGVIGILMDNVESGKIDLYALFCEFDQDKDGRLTYEEFWVMFGGVLHLFNRDIRKLYEYLEEN